MKNWGMISTVAAATLLLGSPQAQAAGKSCLEDKAAIAGAYTSCRFAEYVRAMEAGVSADYTTCEQDFTSGWERLASWKGGHCFVAGHEELVRVAAQESSVAPQRALVGAPYRRCGNGIVEQGEDCDFGNLGGATCASYGFDDGELACAAECVHDTSGCFNVTVEPTPTPQPEPTPESDAGVEKRVFVTAGGYTGDLGGLAGADAECNTLAAAAGLGGTWVAWLSTPTTNAADRVSDTAYRLLDGSLVANGLADLTDGTLSHAINVDQTGRVVRKYVWTGTAADGTFVDHQGDDCSDWTSGSGMGRLGFSDASDSTWTNRSGAMCDLCCPNPGIYCFEQ